ncbi:cystathionine gamma-synthase [Pyronema domesticum]|nr:cystathionine gamma-synthase [Pyronema domesticum]
MSRYEVGCPLPPHDPHAISVSLPTWESNVAWGNKESWVVDKMKTGYPRFFVARSITALAEDVVWRYGNPESETALIFPAKKTAKKCVSFLHAGRIIPLSTNSSEKAAKWLSVFVVVFPKNLWPQARAFWQHTGDGVSTRQVMVLRELWNADLLGIAGATKDSKDRSPVLMGALDKLCDHCIVSTKQQLRNRIAGLISTNSEIAVAEDHVFLYPTGMSAIYAISRSILSVLGSDKKAVCFGFGYTDTLKVLTKLGSGCHFFGTGNSVDLHELSTLLSTGESISAIFCELPTNPLLQTPDLVVLRGLATTYNIPLVVDETIGTFVNVDVLPFADVVVTSLSKAFGGKCNVMGGSVVLNPTSPFYSAFHRSFTEDFEDTYFPLDASVMLSNSAPFSDRIQTMNTNALAISRILARHPTVQTVYYPGLNPEGFDRFRKPKGGYGFLITIRFKRQQSAMDFFDALDVAKGPSLGTVFTLACPYTLLAHMSEIDWAAEYGVVEDLVRISVGVEEMSELVAVVEKALAVLEVETVQVERPRL